MNNSCKNVCTIRVLIIIIELDTFFTRYMPQLPDESINKLNIGDLTTDSMAC